MVKHSKLIGSFGQHLQLFLLGGFVIGISNPVTVTIEAIIHSPVENVWNYWTDPKHITQWNQASEDWHTPYAENDLKVGGKFVSRMEAKDGSFGFDFGGVYDEVNLNERLVYTIGDGRKVTVIFEPQGNDTKIIQVFETEDTNDIEMQQAGWQAILNNFKKHVENAKDE